jgi:hypothetical protein
MGAVAGMAALGNRVGQLVGAGRLGIPQGQQYPSGAGVQEQASTQINAPLMPSWKAARLVMSIPEYRALLHERAFNQYRHVTHIDPDIDCIRSYSLMAKVTFQRQRNIDRHLEAMMEEPDYEREHPVHAYIQKLMWGR